MSSARSTRTTWISVACVLIVSSCGGGGGSTPTDQPVPSNPLRVSVAPASAVEGHGSGASLDFEVTLETASSDTVSVDFTTRDGTATAGRDYLAQAGTLQFAPGQTRRVLSVPIVGDGLLEGDETLTIELANVSTNARLGVASATGTLLDDEAARRYERVEIGFDLPGAYANSFDLDEVTVTMRVVRPDQSTIDVPAFHYREFEIVGIAPERYGNGGAPTWRARYTPTQLGAHAYSIVVIDAAGTRTAGGGRFVAGDGASKGFVRRDARDGRFLRHDDGTPFVPIGHNVAWEDGTGLGTAFWNDVFARMAAKGENWTRIHLVHYWDGQSLEWTPNHTGYYVGLGRYSLELAWKIDRIVEAAERHGIAIQLTLLNNVIFNTQTTPQWQDNPYNVRNAGAGGFLQRPEDFFSDPQARRLMKRQLRYLVARWSYSPAILCWELLNEAYLVDGFGSSQAVRDAVIDWHREMADHLRSIDPAQHLITTGSAEDARMDPVWSHPTIDLVQFHNYRRGMIGAMEIDLARLQHLGKPILIGEFGVEDQQAETRVETMPEPERTQLREALALHNGIWAASMLNSGAMLWWWDRYIHALDLYGEFAPLAAYWAGEDPALHGLARAAASVRGGPQHEQLHLRPGIGDFWTPPARTAFTVGADGSVPGFEGMTVWLHGNGQPTLRSDPSFTMTLARAGSLRLAVQEVSPYAAALAIDVDGVSTFSASYGGGQTNFVVDVPLPAGSHVVRVRNTGNDWIKVDHYTFDGVQLPAVAALGQTSASRGYLWVRDKDSDYHLTDHGPISGTTVSISGLQDRDYRIEFWRTRQPGGPIGTAQARASAGVLEIALPEFTKDVAVKWQATN